MEKINLNRIQPENGSPTNDVIRIYYDSNNGYMNQDSVTPTTTEVGFSFQPVIDFFP